MSRPARTALPALLVLLLGTGVGGCGGGSAETPETVAAPSGLAAYVDQSRVERVGRGAFVRLVDESGSELVALGARAPTSRSTR